MWTPAASISKPEEADLSAWKSRRKYERVSHGHYPHIDHCLSVQSTGVETTFTTASILTRRRPVFSSIALRPWQALIPQHKRSSEGSARASGCRSGNPLRARLKNAPL